MRSRRTAAATILSRQTDHLSKYSKSLGLEDHNSPLEKGITLSQWNTQLQEALDALDSCDTDKARLIFNKLISCHPDDDIAKSLQKIVSDIDAITTGAY